ncbi:hypothetical protein [Argonema galeatum]|uniref:hypothetical protein n=1 Tax=Argonema galeatum TaxID=2942762 RepID=UPI002011BE90|nr:hypothetical protein [Argonema galeatum]MCL1466044.1 hypothetical protein [Argonema galeatum A003/A1]
MPWQLRDYFTVVKSSISQQQFTSFNLVIKAALPLNPRHWIAAGWCKAIWNEPFVGNIESESFTLSIGKAKLITLPNLSPYQIQVDLREWIESVNIEIYEFMEQKKWPRLRLLRHLVPGQLTRVQE